MQILSKADFLKDHDGFVRQLGYGAVFIYPTDTLYGIGCDARNNGLVQRIRMIKNNRDNPLSVIAPSKDWIKKNLECKFDIDKCMEKLPGPYTLIMKRRFHDCVSEDVNPFNDTLGVRIPDNWFAEVVEKLGFPIITTSINVHGQEPFTSIKDVPENIKFMVDLIIDDGVIKGNPSTLIDMTGTKPKEIPRK